MRVRALAPHDIDAVLPLRRALFEDCDEPCQRRDLADLFAAAGPPGTIGNAAGFVAEHEGRLLGFTEVMLRSHAEGAWQHTTEGRLGVAYLEAWYVAPEARGTGVGRALVRACEGWAQEQGSAVLASDAVLDNLHSQPGEVRSGPGTRVAFLVPPCTLRTSILC